MRISTLLTMIAIGGFLSLTACASYEVADQNRMARLGAPVTATAETADLAVKSTTLEPDAATK